jgi:hypothetical protein
MLLRAMAAVGKLGGQLPQHDVPVQPGEIKCTYETMFMLLRRILMLREVCSTGRARAGGCACTLRAGHGAWQAASCAARPGL